MPKYQTLNGQELGRLPRRALSSREQKALAEYRSIVQKMLANKKGMVSALGLSDSEIEKVATIKRWLHRAARDEGVRIRVQKRGQLLIIENESKVGS